MLLSNRLGVNRPHWFFWLGGRAGSSGLSGALTGTGACPGQGCSCSASWTRSRIVWLRAKLLWLAPSRRSSLRRRSQHPACPLTAARAAAQPGRRRTQPAILSTDATNPGRGATFLRLGATSGNATEGPAVIAIPLFRAPLHLFPFTARSTTSCRSPRAAERTCLMYIFSALPIAACATATGRLRRRNAPRSASSALLARRSTRLADGLQVDVAGRGTLRISARGAYVFAAASSDPGRGLPSTNLPLPVIGTIANDPLCALCSAAIAPSIMAVNPCILLPALSLSHACRGSICVCA